MIRTDQEGKWQLRAECIFRFKTKKEMDKFAHENATRIIEVYELNRGLWHNKQIKSFGKTISLY